MRPLAALALLAAAGALAFFLTRERPARLTGAWMVAAGVEPRYEAVGGLRLRYVRRGSGPPVLLLHGIASSIYSWAEVIPALAPDHDVVALDLPGFGGSDIPGSFSGAEYPRLVAEFLDRLGLRRVDLVGHSLGGAVACALAAAEPGRVEKLVLIDSAGFNLAPADRPWLLRVAGWGPPAAVVETLPVERPLVTLGLRQVFYDRRRVTDERVEEYLAPLRRPGTARFMARLLQRGEDLGLPAALSRVRAPTLVVWGRQDRWVPLRDAERFRSAIPGARLAVIEACGHVPQEERPRELAALLRDFLAR